MWPPSSRQVPIGAMISRLRRRRPASSNGVNNTWVNVAGMTRSVPRNSTNRTVELGLAEQAGIRPTDAMTVPSLAALLERAAERFPHAGVVFDDDHQGYAELLEAAKTYAGRLHALGVKPGETVGIFAGDRPEYLHALYGAILLGAGAVPVNARFKVRELGHAISNARLRVLFCGGGIAGHDKLVQQALGAGDTRVIAWDPEAPAGFLRDFETIEPAPFTTPELDLDDPAMLL